MTLLPDLHTRHEQPRGLVMQGVLHSYRASQTRASRQPGHLGSSYPILGSVGPFLVLRQGVIITCTKTPQRHASTGSQKLCLPLHSVEGTRVLSGSCSDVLGQLVQIKRLELGERARHVLQDAQHRP